MDYNIDTVTFDESLHVDHKRIYCMAKVNTGNIVEFVWPKYIDNLFTLQINTNFKQAVIIAKAGIAKAGIAKADISTAATVEAIAKAKKAIAKEAIAQANATAIVKAAVNERKKVVAGGNLQSIAYMYKKRRYTKIHVINKRKHIYCKTEDRYIPISGLVKIKKNHSLIQKGGEGAEGAEVMVTVKFVLLKDAVEKLLILELILSTQTNIARLPMDITQMIVDRFIPNFRDKIRFKLAIEQGKLLSPQVPSLEETLKREASAIFEHNGNINMVIITLQELCLSIEPINIILTIQDYQSNILDLSMLINLCNSRRVFEIDTYIMDSINGYHIDFENNLIKILKDVHTPALKSRYLYLKSKIKILNEEINKIHSFEEEYGLIDDAEHLYEFVNWKCRMDSTFENIEKWDSSPESLESLEFSIITKRIKQMYPLSKTLEYIRDDGYYNAFLQ